MKSTVEEVERLRSENDGLKELVDCMLRLVHSEVSSYDKLSRLSIKAIETVMDAWREQREKVIAKDARIKELEEMIKQLGRLAFMHDVPLEQIIAHFVAWGKSNYDYTSRLEAAFLEQFAQGIQAPKEKAELMAREALERIKEGGKDEL